MAADFCRELLIELGVKLMELMEKKLYCFTGENKFWCMFAQIKVQTKPIQS